MGRSSTSGYISNSANAVALRQAIEIAARDNPDVPHPVDISVALVPNPRRKQEVPVASPSIIADAAFVNGYHEWKANPSVTPALQYPKLNNTEIDNALGACVGRNPNATLKTCQYIGKDILARQAKGMYK